MRKRKLIKVIIFCAIVFVSVLPMLIFMQDLKITKYSIAAIGLLVFHLLYGLLAYIYQNKGNYLRFSGYFIRRLDIILLRKNQEYTFTTEYEKNFNRMLATYYSVIPMYLPCIFLTSKPSQMPIALIVFLIPQVIFIFKEYQEKIAYIKERKRLKQLNEQLMEKELREQEKRESMGKWK
ncbi:MAG: hypothetical protein E7670_01010 [Ruminococcaceae bacterium]|nr:hypothetical protein [Oscillospiraceae bacterium]